MRTSVVCALVGVAGLATSAAAQSLTFSISGPTTVLPGDTATYTVSAAWSGLPTTDPGDHFAGGAWFINIADAAGDLFDGRESAGLGRATKFRNFPSGPQQGIPNHTTPLVGDVSVGMTGTASGRWEGAQIPQIFSGTPDTSNPVTFMTFNITFGDVGVRNLSTDFSVAAIAQGPLGIPIELTPAQWTDAKLTVTVVPAPASLALLGLGGLVAIRRRR